MKLDEPKMHKLEGCEPRQFLAVGVVSLSHRMRLLWEEGDEHPSSVPVSLSGVRLVRTNSTLLSQGSVHSGLAS